MKKEIIQRILLILVMTAVLIYTFYNYQAGKFDQLYLIVFVVVLGYPLVSNVSRLISDLRSKD